MKKICVILGLVTGFLRTADAFPILRMNFSSDTDGSVPATAAAQASGTNAAPTALLASAGASCLVRSSPMDAGTNQLFESSNTVEMANSGTGDACTIRFDASGTSSTTGQVRVDADIMIDSTISGTGAFSLILKDLSDAVVSTARVKLETREVTLQTYDAAGNSLGEVLLGVAPSGRHFHLQVQLDYGSGTASLTGDNLLYTPDPLAYTRTVSGGFAKNRGIARLDTVLASGPTRAWVDNICLTPVTVLPASTAADFGASGNGSDETTALTNAIAALGSSISKLTLASNKTYLISHTISLIGRKDFLLEGNNSTIKVADGAAVDSDHRGLEFQNCENFTVQNLTLDANRANRVPSATNAHAITTTSSGLFRYKNVKAINGVCDGFYVATASPADPESFPRNGLFLNCVADNCFRQGMSIINGNHLAIVGGSYNHTSGTVPAAGIDVESNPASYAPSHIGILVRDATFDGNDGASLSVAGTGAPRNVTIEENSFFRGGNSAVLLGSSYSAIRHNFFENFMTKGSAFSVIYLKSYPTSSGCNLIERNWFSHISTGTDAVHISLSTGPGNQVNNNVISDYTGPSSPFNPGSGTASGNETSYACAAHYALDSMSGSILADSSGHLLHGTAHNGPLWVPGQYGYALSFSGSTQYGLLPDSTLLDVTDRFTLAAWFKADGASSTASHIVLGKYNDFRFGYSGGTNFGFYSSLTGWVYAPASKGDWHHAAVTFDGNRVRLYLDGAQVKNCEVKPGAVTTLSQVTVGSFSGTTYPFQGVVDEVRIYPLVLSQAAIQHVAATPDAN